MDDAYSSDSGVFVLDRTAYVSGTRSTSDLFLDIGLPFGSAFHNRRFQELDRLYHSGRIDRVVGHSLGGAIAHAFGTRNDVEVVTYGAPGPFVKQTIGREVRMRDYLDPVSVLDFAAVTRYGVRFPHTLGRN